MLTPERSLHQESELTCDISGPLKFFMTPDPGWVFTTKLRRSHPRPVTPPSSVGPLRLLSTSNSSRWKVEGLTETLPSTHPSSPPPLKHVRLVDLVDVVPTPRCEETVNWKCVVEQDCSSHAVSVSLRSGPVSLRPTG